MEYRMVLHIVENGHAYWECGEAYEVGPFPIERLVDLAKSMIEEVVKDKGLPAPSGWIPCAERMPEIDVDVLVFTGGPTMLLNSDRVAIGCWAGSDWETSLGVYNPPIISHWMPLPEGPEVKG